MRYEHPSNNKSKRGMRTYGIYQIEDYPDWNVLVTDFAEYPNDLKTLRGIAFFKDGTMDCLIEILFPVSGKEIGYVYKPNKDFTLHLEYKKTT